MNLLSAHMENKKIPLNLFVYGINHNISLNYTMIPLIGSHSFGL